MKKEKYIRKILSGIKATDKIKKRIEYDLQTEFENKEEMGLTIEEIISQKGTSKEVADEFNQAYSDTKVQRQYYSQKSLIIAAIVLISLSVLILIISIFLSKDTAVGIIGGDDGVTVLSIAPHSLGMFLFEIFGTILFLVGCAFVITYYIKRKTSNIS